MIPSSLSIGPIYAILIEILTSGVGGSGVRWAPASPPESDGGDPEGVRRRSRKCVKRARYDWCERYRVCVGHSALCVMCLVDTMWVPLVVSLSSLFKKAFSYTRGAGFAQVRGERGPTTWLGLQSPLPSSGAASIQRVSRSIRA